MGATKKNPEAETLGAPYLVLSPLMHDGVRYEPGDTVYLSPESDAALIDLHVVGGVEKFA